MMCYIVTALDTLPGALLSIQVHANEGLCGGIGERTLECPSICLTYLRDVLKTPRRTREKRRMKCVIREKKQPTVWMTSLREAQGHCISMLTFTLWKEAYCQSYGKSCGAFTGGSNTHTHTLVDFKALVTLTSPFLHITLNPHLCFAFRVYKHPLPSQVFPICPCPLWAGGTAVPWLWTIGVTWQMEGVPWATSEKWPQ